MTRETMGAKHKYAQSLIPSQARLLATLPPDSWPREIDLVCADFRTHYFDNEATGLRQFKDTMAQTLTLAQVAGAPSDAVVSARKQIEALAQGRTIEVSLDPSDDDILEGLDDADVNLNMAPPPESPLTIEMRKMVEHCAAKWSEDAPFYAVRSKEDPTVLLVSTSVGRHEETGVKTNVNGSIGSARNLNEIDDKYKVDGVRAESEDANGRAYFVRAVKIVDGAVLRLWLSRLDHQTRRWEQILSRRLVLDNAVKHGFTLQK